MTKAGERIVVVGAGGHAKVVVELARSVGLDVVGCTDHGGRTGEVVGAPILGGDDLLSGLHSAGVASAVVALGDNAARWRVGQWVRSLGFRLPALVSPAATVSPSATLGDGTVIMAGAVVNADVRIGEFVIVNTCASIDHDGEVGAGAHIAPGAHLSGGVRVGTGALIGVGAAVLPGVVIGERATLGGGSAAISNISAGDTAVGSPAHSLRRS